MFPNPFALSGTKHWLSCSGNTVIGYYNFAESVKKKKKMLVSSTPLLEWRTKEFPTHVIYVICKYHQRVRHTKRYIGQLSARLTCNNTNLSNHDYSLLD